MRHANTSFSRLSRVIARDNTYIEIEVNSTGNSTWVVLKLPSDLLEENPR